MVGCGDGWTEGGHKESHTHPLGMSSRCSISLGRGCCQIRHTAVLGNPESLGGSPVVGGGGEERERFQSDLLPLWDPPVALAIGEGEVTYSRAPSQKGSHPSAR